MTQPNAIEALAGLIEMIEAADNEQGSVIFNHTPEEIGIEVMENHNAVLTALRAQDAAPVAVGRDPFLWVLAALDAATSILDRAHKAGKQPKLVVGSDKMFEQMQADYAKALEAGRNALNHPSPNPAPQAVAADGELLDALAKLRLWFFRECNEGTRRHLFALFGLPLDEITNNTRERLCFNHIMKSFTRPNATNDDKDGAGKGSMGLGVAAFNLEAAALERDVRLSELTPEEVESLVHAVLATTIIRTNPPPVAEVVPVAAFRHPRNDELIPMSVPVPWTTVKEIMKAIAARAALANRGEAGALEKERAE